MWDSTTWKEVAKAKPLAKGQCDSMAFSPRAGAGCGGESSMLLASGERPCIWGMCALPCCSIFAHLHLLCCVVCTAPVPWAWSPPVAKSSEQEVCVRGITGPYTPQK